MRFGQPSRAATALVCLVLADTTLAVRAADGATATASSSSEGSEAGGAVDGNRFSVERASAWKGRTSAGRWWWQVEFERTRHVGAILQVVGDHAFVFRNAPLQFVWQRSADGTHWSDLPETATTNERRLFRIHRLARAVEARFLRLNIAAAQGIIAGKTIRAKGGPARGLPNGPVNSPSPPAGSPYRLYPVMNWKTVWTAM